MTKFTVISVNTVPGAVSVGREKNICSRVETLYHSRYNMLNDVKYTSPPKNTFCILNWVSLVPMAVT